MDPKEIAALLKTRPDLAERLATMVAEPAKDRACLVPVDCARHLGPLLMGLAYESVAVLALNNKNRPIGCEILGGGGADGFCIVDARRIFRWALLQGKSGAKSIILAHNHPSGELTPSREDIEVTKTIGAAGRTLGISLLDHLIFTDSTTSPGYSFISMAERGHFMI